MKNRFSLLGILILLMVIASGCIESGPPQAESDAKASTGESADEGITIGVTNMTLKESVYHFMKEAAEEKSEELGAELIWQSSENDPTVQFNQVQNFVAQGVDVLVIEPARSDAADRHVKLAQDAGIPVINIEAMIQGVGTDLRISANNYDIGVMQVEDFAEAWGDKPANVVILSGTKGDEAADTITQGALDTLEKYPQYTVIVQQAHTGWDRQLAMNTMENALAKFDKDIQVVFSNNDTMVHGAMKAAQVAGVEQDILFYGSDADKDSIELLIEGKENLKVVDRGSQLQGANLVEAAVKVANGEEVPQDEIVKNGEHEIPVWWTPMELISKDNLEPMKEKYPELFE